MTVENSSRQLELYERANEPSISEQHSFQKHSWDSGQQSHVLPGDFITSVHHEAHSLGLAAMAAGCLTVAREL